MVAIAAVKTLTTTQNTSDNDVVETAVAAFEAVSNLVKLKQKDDPEAKLKQKNGDDTQTSVLTEPPVASVVVNSRSEANALSDTQALTNLDTIFGTLAQTATTNKVVVVDVSPRTPTDQGNEIAEGEPESDKPATPKMTIGVVSQTGSVFGTQTDTETKNTTVVVTSNLVSSPSMTGAQPITTALETIVAGGIADKTVTTGNTSSVLIVSGGEITGTVAVTDVVINQGTETEQTIKIAVVDLKSDNSDALSSSLLESGQAQRQRLFQFLGQAYGIGEADNLPPGADFLTANILAFQGLAVDDTYSINPTNDFYGGLITANASTYIGSVLPPDLTDHLRSIGATEEFISGYNFERDRVIEWAQQKAGWDEPEAQSKLSSNYSSVSLSSQSGILSLGVSNDGNAKILDIQLENSLPVSNPVPQSSFNTLSSSSYNIAKLPENFELSDLDTFLGVLDSTNLSQQVFLTVAIYSMLVLTLKNQTRS